MTEGEISELLGYDGPVPRNVREVLALVPVPQTGAEAVRVTLAALAAAGQLGHGLAAATPDLRRRRR